MVIHHLAVDGVSWRIMLEDLGEWYEQRKRGEAMKGKRKTTSFKQWAEKLEEYSRSGKVEEERGYWEKEESKAVEELKVDYEGGENVYGEEERVIRVLEKEETEELLKEAGKAHNTQVMDLLLGALVGGLKQWGGYERVRVELEGHGREEVMGGVDLTRTVGWFTSLYPVVLEWRGGESVGERIERVKEEMRGVPEKGIGYGVLRYMREGRGKGRGEEWKAGGRREPRRGEGQLLVNYLGQFDQAMGEAALLKGAKEGSGAGVGGECRRAAKVEMNALVISGQLQMTWSYSRRQYRRETIERLAETYENSLREIILHCTAVHDRAFMDDFDQSGIDASELDYLEQKVGAAGN
jgi:non-ribosomal peptide synthase protein (TIGR01720 family)